MTAPTIDATAVNRTRRFVMFATWDDAPDDLSWAYYVCDSVPVEHLDRACTDDARVAWYAVHAMARGMVDDLGRLVRQAGFSFDRAAVSWEAGCDR